jgi:hypothetical protein
MGFSMNSIDDYNKTLVYENDFNNFDDLDDWVLEGPGRALLADGKMMLLPDAQQNVYRKWEESGRKRLKAHTEYYPAVKEAIGKYNPDMIEKVSNADGKVVGGHIVCWNKAFETDENYIVEYDFKPLSPIGLGIIFFSAKGVNGEDVLSDSLEKRYGVFSQYIFSDINCYHISYWANATGNIRGTSNLRKNTGAFCLANGIDPSVKGFDPTCDEFNLTTHRMKLVKIKNNIKLYIDGVLSIDYTDKRFNNIVSEEGLDNVIEENVDTGEVLGGGRVGLRQMVDLAGLYDNFKVYNLNLN